MQLCLRISGIANSVDPDQTAPSDLIYSNIFLHTRPGFPRILPVLTNLTLSHLSNPSDR